MASEDDEETGLSTGRDFVEKSKRFVRLIKDAILVPSSDSVGTRPVYSLNWHSVPLDILFDRVFNKTLNAFYLYVSAAIVITLYNNNVLPIIALNGSWSVYVSSTLNYVLYASYGLLVAALNVLPMGANGIKGADSVSRKIMMVMYPLGATLYFVLNWHFTSDHDVSFLGLLFLILPLAGTGACFFYLFVAMTFEKKAHFNRVYTADEQHVSSLLKGTKALEENHPENDITGNSTDGDVDTAHPPESDGSSAKIHAASSSAMSKSEMITTKIVVSEETGDSSPVHGASVRRKKSPSEEEKLEAHSTLPMDMPKTAEEPRPIVWRLHPAFQVEGSNNLSSTVHQSGNAKKLAREAFIIEGLEEEPENTRIPCESSLTDFFGRYTWTEIYRDVKQQTPQLLILGLLLGTASILLFLAYIPTQIIITTDFQGITDQAGEPFKSLAKLSGQISDFDQQISRLEMNATRVYNATQVNETALIIQIDDALAQLGYVNVTFATVSAAAENVRNTAMELREVRAFIAEAIFAPYDDLENKASDLFESFKKYYNISVYSALATTALISIFSLLWPLIVAVNIRNNLRTGLWRHNRKAYMGSYNRYTAASIPGMMIGMVLVGFTLIAAMITIIFLVCFWTPLRVWLWDLLGDIVIGICAGIVVKMVVLRLLFVVWLKDENNDMREINTYSFAFCVMLFFNLLYGTLAALYRLLYFIIYTLFALVRLDTTLLPQPFWGFDAGFSSFNAYLLSEHETKNSILRIAVEVLAAGQRKALDRPTNVRARVRWHLAYTLLHNPSLIRLRRRGPHPSYFEGDKDGLGDAQQPAEPKTSGSCGCRINLARYLKLPGFSVNDELRDSDLAADEPPQAQNAAQQSHSRSVEMGDVYKSSHNAPLSPPPAHAVQTASVPSEETEGAEGSSLENRSSRDTTAVTLDTGGSKTNASAKSSTFSLADGNESSASGGQYTGRAGRANLTAAAEGVSDSESMTVEASPPDSITTPYAGSAPAPSAARGSWVQE